MRVAWSSSRSRALALCLLVACGGTGGSSGAPQAPRGGVTLNVKLAHEHYRLANGLEVVLHRDPSLRNAIVDVRYDVGGKDDPPGRSGFAHLFEHLMFLGSKNVSELDFAQVLDDAGAVSYNAFTTQDFTEYFEVVPPSQLPVALWIEADRMAHPIERVYPETFARERDVVKNEWRERYDNVPYGHVGAIIREALFPEGHPYCLPPIGRVEDLDRATVDDAKAFAARYYMPANATLIVAGDIDIGETKKLVEARFASIPSPKERPRVRTFPFPRLTKDREVIVEADVEAARVLVTWPIPPLHTRGWDEIHLAASTITSMTAYKVETKDKIARNGGWDIIDGRLGSRLEISFELEPRSANEWQSVVDSLETRVRWISDLADNGQEWSDFSDLRTQRMTRRVLSLADIEDRATRMHEYLDCCGKPDDVQGELRRIQAVRPVDAAQATRDLLHASGKLIVVVKPTKGAPRAGRVKP